MIFICEITLKSTLNHPPYLYQSQYVSVFLAGKILKNCTIKVIQLKRKDFPYSVHYHLILDYISLNYKVKERYLILYLTNFFNNSCKTKFVKMLLFANQTSIRQFNLNGKKRTKFISCTRLFSEASDHSSNNLHQQIYLTWYIYKTLNFMQKHS